MEAIRRREALRGERGSGGEGALPLVAGGLQLGLEVLVEGGLEIGRAHV